MGEPHHQFPQPTRPMQSYDAIPLPSLSKDEYSQEYRKPEALELPQTRNDPKPILLRQYTEKQVEDLFSQNISNFDETSSSNEQSSPGDRLRFSPATGKTPKDEKEAVDELLLILLEVMDELNTRSREALLKKFFLEIEREERLERFIVARLKQSKVKAITELCQEIEENIEDQLADSEKDDEDLDATRSIQESVEELSQKLERFKVRTFEGAGEEIKQEEENSKK